MRRRFGLYLALGLLASLASAQSASAQGTTLQMVPQTVSPGQVVTVTGGSFNNTAVGVGPVNIRINTRDGQILLGGADLNSRGQLNNVQFPFPNLAPGTYLVLATQTYANGRQVAFTPGRTRIRVAAAAGSAAGAAADRGGPPAALPLTAAVLALILLTAGLGLTARRLRAHTSDSRQLGA